MLLDQASRNTDQADLIILAHVETIRDQSQPASASAVAALIGGAPVVKINIRLAKLAHMGLLELIEINPARYQLSEMGAELLRRDLIGWSPSNREDRRRELKLLSAVSGSLNGSRSDDAPPRRSVPRGSEAQVRQSRGAGPVE
jgi:hypothetical protein